MHAVVVSLTITDAEAAEQVLNTQLVPRVFHAPGLISGYWTTTGASALSVFVFETRRLPPG
jgi:hypothetical protein